MNLIKNLLIIILFILNTTNVEALEKEDMQKKESSLYDNGIDAYQQGNYNLSIEYFKKSLTISKKIYGDEHFAISKNYHALGMLYGEIGDYPKSLTYSKKSLIIIEKTLGTEHAETAKVYNQIGVIYETIGDYTNALQFHQKALSIREKVLSKEHIETAGSYNNLGSLHQTIGDYSKAMYYHQMALSIRKKVLGDEHQETARSYSNMGWIYGRMRDYPSTLKFYQKALSIRKKVLGEEHLDTAESYSDLGWIYRVMEDHNKALTFNKKSLRIKEKILGNRHIDTAQSYSDIGTQYKIMGDYSNALKHYHKALKIKEKVLGKEHIKTAMIYNRLGLFYQAMEDNSKALEYLKRTLEIREKILGKEHDSTAESYNDLGSIYHQIKDYPKAINYYWKALSTKAKVFGMGHTSTGEIYLKIGTLFQLFGDNTKALKYYQQALVIHEKNYGKEHSSTATSYISMGSIYEDKKNYKKALKYYHKALNIYKNTYGEQHSITTVAYLFLSLLHQKKKNYSQAHQYANLLVDIFLQNRDKVFTVLDSQQKEKYLKANTPKIDLLLNISTQYLSQLKKEKKMSVQIQQLIKSVTNVWLNYKGSIFDSENNIAMLYNSTKDKKLKTKIDELVSSKRYLAKLYQSLPKLKERKVWKKNIMNTEERIAKLSNEISSKTNSFKEQQGLQSITYKDISSHLKKDELYIDYAKTKKYYYLFSLDYKKNITFVQINKNSTKRIDSLIEAFRNDVNTILNGKDLTDARLKVLTENSKEKLSQLYTLVIKNPLRDILKDKTGLIISPDGALRLLPFETLYDKEKEKYFIEEKEIRYIPSGKELIRLYKYSKDKVSKITKSVVIFANPNFNSKIASVSKEQIDITPNTNRSSIIKSLFRMRFAPLPGTKAEAEAIKATFSKKSILEYQDNKATESTLMKIKQPNILHIATHGFFINDNTIPNPMLKSGIALAGANASAIKGKSDGIVTALKLSGLDLKGTDLVVLSACQTGVVDINSTDSVSGLSKAFIQAGAKDIVMSLWSVDDEATKDLMTSFYQEMKENRNYAESLKVAKLKMIEEGRHPFYWGAFVLSGL